MNGSDSLSLSNRVAVVTGASRGIGKAIALELARRGAKVVINYLKNEQAASEVLEEIRKTGGEATTYQADISQFDQAQGLIKSSVEQYGKIDILVNNAGITRDTLIMMMSEEDWDIVQAINLKGTFNCSKAAVRYMMRQKYGRIINITSVSGQIGNAGQCNYSASKAGQIGFTKALAREVASRNITVNAIAAGYIETDIWENVPQEMKEAFLQLIPLGRKGKPEEVAYAVAFLASDQAAYITGQILGVDGGMAMM
ncbi:MAG: 3-oxoacyl-[acyl-carrier-protein] reductase [Anaerolineales bacterium]